MQIWVSPSQASRCRAIRRSRSALPVLGQVTEEAEEGVAVHAGRHQGEQDGRGADPGDHLDAQLVGARHQRRSGVGDAGASGLGQQHRVGRGAAAGGAQRREPCVDARGVGFVPDLDDVQACERRGMADRLEERARAAGIFDQEIARRLRRGHGRSRQHPGSRPRRTPAALRRPPAAREPGEPPARRGARHRRAQRAPGSAAGRCTPIARSIEVSAISGSPISAVGSSQRTAVTRQIASDSILADPAQSYGRSACR